MNKKEQELSNQKKSNETFNSVTEKVKPEIACLHFPDIVVKYDVMS